MKPTFAPRRLWLGVLLLLVAGCASDAALKEGERLIAEGQSEAGLKVLEQAMRDKPGDLAYRAAYVRQRDLHIARLMLQGDAALQAGDLETAQARFQQVLELHPQNSRAPAGLAAIQISRRNQELLEEARAAQARNDTDGARGKLRAILAQSPEHAQAQALVRQLDAQSGKGQGIEPNQLGEAYRKPITLEFRDAPLRSVFDAISRQSGLNFVFDKDVRHDQKTSVYARVTPISEAVDMILTTAGLAKKVLNSKTLMIYPNIPAKQKDYQEMAVRSFFLANAEAKTVMAMLKTIAKVRDVHVDEKLNMVMMRDTPETIRVAEKLINLADRQEPEVMLDVEILEVKRSKLMELGLQWPTQFSLLAKEKVVDKVTDSSGNTISQSTKYLDVPLTLELLRGIDGSQIGISPTPGVIARKDDGDVSLLANPRIRVRNKEKAKIHIGDKVPVITSNVTSTGVTSESVSYLDVGLKLDVEPQVYLDGDVAMKVGLEVSSIVQQVKTANGTLTYQLGSRNANTVLRLKDGETQVLAGLIADEDRNSASRVPGLGDLPLLGRLFANHRDEASKTEIVLLITPRILRKVGRPDLGESEFLAGTEMSLSLQPLRLGAGAGIPRPPLPIGNTPGSPPPEEMPPPAVDESPAPPEGQPPTSASQPGQPAP